MPILAYVAQTFQHPHEQETFTTLVETLNVAFVDEKSRSLIGNVMFNGRELDAVLPLGFLA